LSLQKRILAFGNPVYDKIVTPFIGGGERVLSGCSTNACLAITKLGEHATLVGSVGPDFSEQLREDLERWNVKSDLLPSRQTGGFSLIYDERGDRELTVLGVADPISTNKNGFGDADFVLFGPILGETPVKLAERVRATMAAPIFLDPQGLLRRLEGNKVVHVLSDEFVAMARLTMVIKANELETHIVTGLQPRRDPEAAVRALHRFGCRIAVVTLAEAGSIIYDGQQLYRIPPYTTRAVDPTGAGDTYAAGFMVKYLETPHDLTAVGCFASAVASIMVENSGPAFPLTRTEADRRTQALLAGPPQLLL